MEEVAEFRESRRLKSTNNGVMLREATWTDADGTFFKKVGMAFPESFVSAPPLLFVAFSFGTPCW